MTRFLIFLMCACSVQAAQVRFAFTNALGNPDTNSFLVVPIGSVIQSDGSFITRGVPTRLMPAADGKVTNSFEVGHYQVTNRYMASGFLIRVPNDSGSTIYDATVSTNLGGLAMSGYNTFVTFDPTFSAITNALGYLPATNGVAGGDGVAVDASGVATASTNAGVVTVAVTESGIESVVDLQDLQGAVTDAQVPNTITVDLATTATTANAGDSATAFFSSGTIEPDRISATFSNLPIYYVDQSVADFSGHGRTPQKAWKSIAQAHTNLGATIQNAHLKVYGLSEFREQLTLGTNNIVESYGVGRAIFNASDVATNWTLVSGLTNTYAVSNFVVTGGSAPSTVPVIEDGTIMIAATSLSACIQTDGSFYSQDSPTAGSTQTVFVNPLGSTDPSTNNRTYEVGKRNYGIVAGNNNIVRGVITRNAMHNNGSLEMGKDAWIENVLAENGTKHNLLFASGSLKNVVAWKASVFSADSIPIVAYSETDGLSVSFEDVHVIGTSPTRLLSDGFYGHTANIDPNPGYASAIFQDCSVTYAGGFGTISPQTNAFTGLFGCRGYGLSERGFAFYAGTNVMENSEFRTSQDVPFSVSGKSIQISGTGRTYLSAIRTVGAPVGIWITVSNAWVSLSDSILEGGNATGVQATTLSNTTLISSNNIIGFGVPYKFENSVGTIFQGNSNVYSYAVTPVGFFLDGPVTNFVQWKAAVAPYDANALTNEMQWLGWATNGDYRFSLTSPAVTNRAGGWDYPTRQSKHPKLESVAPRPLPTLAAGEWLLPRFTTTSNGLVALRLTNTIDIAGGVQFGGTNIYGTNFNGATFSASGGMTNAGMTASAPFSQLRVKDSAASGTSSDHIIEFYDSADSRQAYIYKSAGGALILGNDQNNRPIVYTLNGADRFGWVYHSTHSQPMFFGGSSNANVAGFLFNLPEAGSVTLMNAFGERTGTNHFVVSGNVMVQGTVFATNGVTAVGGTYNGNLSGGTNLWSLTNVVSGGVNSTGRVDWTQLLNVPAGLADGTDDGGGGGGLPGTNSVIAYGSAQRTNASGTFTGLDLVASNANGSVKMIGGELSADVRVQTPILITSNYFSTLDSGGDEITVTNTGPALGLEINSSANPFTSSIYIGGGGVISFGFVGGGSALTNIPGTGLQANTISGGQISLTLDLGGHTSFEIPNAANPTTDAFGEIAGDVNAWATGRGALQIFDGTANTYGVATLASDTPSNGQVPTWNTGGTITWETPVTTGGTNVVNDGTFVQLTNPDGDPIVQVGADSAVITIGPDGQQVFHSDISLAYTRIANPHQTNSWMAFSNSGNIAIFGTLLPDDLTMSGTLKVTELAGTGTRLAAVDENGNMVADPTILQLSAAAFVLPDSDDTHHTRISNKDRNFSASYTNMFPTLSGILGVVSNTAFASGWNGIDEASPSQNAVYDWGVTFDTDADGKVNVIDSTAGTATLTAAGQMDFNTTDKQLGIHNGTKEVAIPTILHKTMTFDPDAVCDGSVDRLFIMSLGVGEPKGIHILAWKVSFEADPTTEVDLDLKRADAFIGVANSAVMDVLDTTAGASSESSSANINGDAVVANGKVVYLEFGTAYTETGHQIIFEMWYELEED